MGHELPFVSVGWDDGSRRAWSLWEMIHAYGRHLFSLATVLASFEKIADLGFQRQEDGAFRDFDVKFAGNMLEIVKGALPNMKALHLEMSYIYAARVIDIWEEDGALGLNRILEGKMIESLAGRIHDELRTRFFMYVPTDKAELYNAPSHGWEEVTDRFPEAIADIQEMNRCVALSRYPAAVFHSVSTIEHGLIALGVFLGVDDPKSGWTAVSGALEKIVSKTKFPDLDPKFQANFGFLEQVNGTVSALKNSWRNKISHAHGRLVVLTPEFTPEIVDEIVLASRAFMRRLATEMP